jgi:hypothetical protein
VLTDRISDALPQHYGFLRGYVEYAATCSDAPEIYHVGVALTVLAATVAHKIRCPWLAGRVLVPNLYTLLVGPSRSSRKTGSMDAGIDLLEAAQPSLVIPLPGSYEELVTQIRATPHGVLTYREFGHFLKTTTRGYGEPIRTVLMDLYDWSPDRAYTRNLKKGKTVIEPPICLSMLSSIATELLFSYCVDEQTEILTAAGWKRHQDVVAGDECYTLNHETGLGEWQRISKVNVFAGQPRREMVRIEGRAHSSLSTLNHRWPVRSKGNSAWFRRWKTSETLNQSDYIQCAARDAGLPTEPRWSDAFVELVAWAWTEGYWNVSNMLGLCQSSRVHPDYCERIRTALFEHLGPRHEGSMFSHRKDAIPLWVEDPPRADTGMIHWRLNQEAARPFTEVLSIPEKVVSLPWLRTLTQQQLELFIETSLAADGDPRKGRLAQKSEARAEAFAFACILAGKPVSYCTLSADHGCDLEIGVLSRYQTSPIANAENGHGQRSWTVERTTHDGPVWCPTTPNGTWLARRNGSVYWTGNTDTEEWTGGFLGRMVLLYGERESFRMPLTWPSARDHLAGVIYQFAQATFPVCGGFSPQAWTIFETWARFRDSQSINAPTRLQTHIAGTSTLAAKVALLYATDQAEPSAGHGWLVSAEAMNRAIMFVDRLYVESVYHLGERLTLGIWERDRQRVLDIIESAKATGIMRRDLLRRVRLESGFLENILGTLREEGTIVRTQDARGEIYRKADAASAKVIPINGTTATGTGTP